MNNLLDFEEYRYKFHLNENTFSPFNFTSRVNEGLMTKWKKYRATKMVDKILHEEIELGKNFEERIKETMQKLEQACKDLGTKSKKGSDFTKNINKIISEINNVSFDTLSLIGEQNIDFSGFRNSIIMYNVIKLGVLLSPIKNYLMIKKAYEYFIGLVKQTIRKDLVMLIINFDQFQSVILQKSTEAFKNAITNREIGEMTEKIWNEASTIISNQTTMSKSIRDQMLKMMKERRELLKDSEKRDAAYNDYMDAYNNTYRTTAESIKQLLNDDNQKQLEAIKNSILKIGGSDDSLSVYGELLISSAEEHALKSSNTIHDNFLKMSEVFKLSNQKELIDLIAEAEKNENKKISKEIKKNREKFNIERDEDKIKFIKDEFNKLKDDLNLKKITIDDINKLKQENVEFTYENTDLEKEPYEEKISKYNIIISYLSSDTKESNHILKKCSPDIKMLIPTSDNYENTYYSYLDYLSDSIEKSLIRKNNNDDECYIDFMVLNSVDDIISVINKFNILNYDDKTKNKQLRILKYINDENSIPIKIEGYERLLDKFKEMSELNKDIDKHVKDNPQENIKEYFNYLNRLNMYNEWDRYRRLLDRWKTTKDKEGPDVVEPKKPDCEEIKEGDKPKFEGEHIQLKVKINEDRYKTWKSTFQKIKTDILNFDKSNDK